MQTRWNLHLPSLDEVTARRLGRWAMSELGADVIDLTNPWDVLVLPMCRREIEALCDGLLRVGSTSAHETAGYFLEYVRDLDMQYLTSPEQPRVLAPTEDPYAAARALSWQLDVGLEHDEELMERLLAHAREALGLDGQLLDDRHWIVYYDHWSEARMLIEACDASLDASLLQAVRSHLAMWLQARRAFPPFPWGPLDECEVDDHPPGVRHWRDLDGPVEVADAEGNIIGVVGEEP